MKWEERKRREEKEGIRGYEKGRIGREKVEEGERKEGDKRRG